MSKKRNSHAIQIEYKGVVKTVKEWSEEVELNHDTLYTRIKKGWPIEKALFLPCRSYYLKCADSWREARGRDRKRRAAYFRYNPVQYCSQKYSS